MILCLDLFGWTQCRPHQGLQSFPSSLWWNVGGPGCVSVSTRVVVPIEVLIMSNKRRAGACKYASILHFMRGVPRCTSWGHVGLLVPMVYVVVACTVFSTKTRSCTFSSDALGFT